LKKIVKVIYALSLMMFALILSNMVTVRADKNEDLQAAMPQLSVVTNEEGFTKSKSLGFFDIDFKPGEEIVLGVKIQNVIDKKIEIKITPGTVISNQGHIVYGDQSEELVDESNQHPFSKMVKKQTVTVEPKSSFVVRIPVEVPKEEFNGTILGNLAFTVLGQEEGAKKANKDGVATITNVVRQAIIVRLRQGTQPDPDFQIGNPATGGTLKGPTFKVPVRNVAATYFSDKDGTSIKYTVTKKDDPKVKFTSSEKNISMAPNSFFEGTVSTKGKAIDPGKYNFQVDIEHKGKMTKLSKDFMVTSANLKNINKDAKLEAKKPKSRFNFVIVAMIAIVVLILLVSLYVGMRQAQKKVKADKEPSDRLHRNRK
jgi:hypothetical protein